MLPLRHFSLSDKACLAFDQFLRASFDNPKTTGRAYPAHAEAESNTNTKKRQFAGSLMRINHAGEVSAQALYHGQGLTSYSPRIKTTMQQAATEEGDHLAWCRTRIMELGSHTSYLNPFWYLGSFSIGAIAGLIGDKWSLGFLAETEHQVVKHLEHHMDLLKEEDPKSYKVLQQMHHDEAKHRDDAIEAGGEKLPRIIQTAMKFLSAIMVKTAYWI